MDQVLVMSNQAKINIMVDAKILNSFTVHRGWKFAHCLKQKNKDLLG